MNAEVLKKGMFLHKCHKEDKAEETGSRIQVFKTVISLELPMLTIY